MRAAGISRHGSILSRSEKGCSDRLGALNGRQQLSKKPSEVAAWALLILEVLEVEMLKDKAFSWAGVSLTELGNQWTHRSLPWD
jgi:hypothetical protein